MLMEAMGRERDDLQVREKAQAKVGYGFTKYL